MIKTCCHIEFGAVAPEEHEIVEDHPIGFSDGEVVYKSYTTVYYRCPLCHAECEPVKGEDENGK